jgi:hypothetical protein
VLVDDGDRAVTGERRRAGQQLEQHAAGRVEVRAGVDLVTARLLR